MAKKPKLKSIMRTLTYRIKTILIKSLYKLMGITRLYRPDTTMKLTKSKIVLDSLRHLVRSYYELNRNKSASKLNIAKGSILCNPYEGNKIGKTLELKIKYNKDYTSSNNKDILFKMYIFSEKKIYNILHSMSEEEINSFYKKLDADYKVMIVKDEDFDKDLAHYGAKSNSET